MKKFGKQLKGGIPRSLIIDQKTINKHDLCYQCSKDGPEFLFGNLSIGDSRGEPYFPAKKLISYE